MSAEMVASVCPAVPGRELTEAFDGLGSECRLILRVWTDLVEVIARAHRREVVHEPARIRLGPDGQVRVLDWESARATSDAADPRRDVKALGRVLTRLLDSPMSAHQVEVRPAPRDEELTLALYQLAETCEQGGFSQAREVLAALDDLPE